jgi:hypothetical protein
MTLFPVIFTQMNQDACLIAKATSRVVAKLCGEGNFCPPLSRNQ